MGCLRLAGHSSRPLDDGSALNDRSRLHLKVNYIASLTRSSAPAKMRCWVCSGRERL
jgi:hypothetical protein